MILGQPRRVRRPVNVRTWAAGIVATHIEGDGGCLTCEALHGTAVAWPCLPLRVARSYVDPSSGSGVSGVSLPGTG